MHLDEIRLRTISKMYRNAIAKADFSIRSVGAEGHARMQGFPGGACAEATKLLAIYLIEEYSIEQLMAVIAQIEEDGRWFGSHYWLEHDGIIIDITADQFPMVKTPVIVTRDSDFHSRYARKVCKSPARFRLVEEPDWMNRLYSAIIESLK